MEKKRLSEVVDFDTHIAPYRIVEIVAGMSSGKNYWVENVLMEERRVLLITSRKAKVEETKHRAKIGSCLNLGKRKEDSLCYLLDNDKEHGSCVCNNWQIEYYMKEKFVPNDAKTHLWEFFDIIIVDEAHSLATDATYADAPFYTLDFIRAVYKFSNKPIVLMTATPAPIDGLIQLKTPDNYHLWDFTEECCCITPERIWHKTRQQTLEEMVWEYVHFSKDSLPKSKVVYFATKISTISKKIIPYLIGSGIPEEAIAVSFSNDESAEGFSPTILNNKKHVENYLREHEDLPPNIQFFFTTSRNKEGINIANPNVYWNVYIESHWKEEAMQMWGRIREGRTQLEDQNCSPINQLVLIDDASQHQTIYCDSDWRMMLSAACKDTVNAVLNQWCVANNIDRKECWSNPIGKAAILDMQKMFLGLRFSITNNRFLEYKGRFLGLRSYAKSVDRFEDYITFQLGGSPMPLVVERPFDIPSLFLMPPDRQEQFDNYIREKGFLNGISLSPQDQKEMLDYLSDTLMVRQKSNPTRKYSTLAKAISEFGYTLKACSKHPTSKLYGYYRLVRVSDIDVGGVFDDAI